MDSPSETEVDDRTPCPDDLCVGVLDANGVCGTCGEGAEADAASDEGDEGDEGDEESSERDDGDDVQAAGVEAHVPFETSAQPLAETDEGLERQPCPDEMCVGILDADARCGTCGRSGR